MTAIRDGGKASVIIPGFLLDPSDVHDSRGGDIVRDSGERRLMLAVLEDALRRFLRRPIKTGKSAASHWRDTYDETAAWFASRSRAWLYDFEHICDVLGLSASYIRRGLAEYDGSRRLKLYRTSTQGFSSTRMVGRVSGSH